MPKSAEEQFHEDMNELVAETRDFLALLENGYQPPEVKVEAIFRLQKHLWDVQLSWTALCHPRHERKESQL